MQGFSLSLLQRERTELWLDRHAFATSLDLLKNRVIESNDTDLPRRPLLHEWSGTRAAIGSLELSLHAIERTISEMDNLISEIENGKVQDLDAPVPVVSGGKN